MTVINPWRTATDNLVECVSPIFAKRNTQIKWACCLIKFLCRWAWRKMSCSGTRRDVTRAHQPHVDCWHFTDTVVGCFFSCHYKSQVTRTVEEPLGLRESEEAWPVMQCKSHTWPILRNKEWQGEFHFLENKGSLNTNWVLGDIKEVLLFKLVTVLWLCKDKNVCCVKDTKVIMSEMVYVLDLV